MTAPDGTELTKGTHYTAELKLGGRTVETVQAAGNYTLTITAVESGGYIGSKTVRFSVKDIPLTIGSAEDWSDFAAMVEYGVDYKGKTVTLTADIEVSKMVGSSEHMFAGTFDGCGYTLTFNSSSASSDVAPFRYINGATIRRLVTAGTIENVTYCVGGVVCRSYGSSTIESCVSSVTINSKATLSAEYGGFVAMSNGTLTIKDCLFNGRLIGPEGESTSPCGGFVGDVTAGAANISNSLFAPQEIKVSIERCASFACPGSSVKLDKCYATQLDGYEYQQGTLVGEGSGTETPEKLAAALGSGWRVADGEAVPILDANNLSRAAVVGIDKKYMHTGKTITLSYTVIAEDGTALAEGMDYTVELKLDGEAVEAVKEGGEYTLTIKGLSPRFNSTTVSFDVLDESYFVNYVYYTYDGQSVTKHSDGYVADFDYLNTSEWGGGKWYVVSENMSIDSRVTVSGTANLILCDDTTLIANFGIEVAVSSTLNIYAQSGGSGKLIATGVASASGIGGENESGCGEVTVCGGIITATGGASAAGIGGGSGGDGGTVTVYGGTVSATGGSDGAAGIGKGYCGFNNGSLSVGGAGLAVVGSVDGKGYRELKKQNDNYSGEKYMVIGRSVTVTVNGGAGSGNYVIGVDAYITAGAPETGKTFDRWTTNDGVTFADSNSVATTFTVPDKNVTVTAAYKSLTYSVTLNLNGGKVNSGNVTGYTFGEGATLPTDVTKDGCAFGGWFEKSDLSGSAVTAIGKSETGNKTYYAKWTELVVSPSVSGAFKSSKFVATVTAPDGGLLIAAVYDANGRQVSVWTKALTAEKTAQTIQTGIDKTSGYTYKLILVNSSYVPQCAAWSK